MKKIWLVDGHSLACRAFFAFIREPLRNSKGENTSAVFGFLNSLIKLLKEKKPEYLVVCFDSGKPTFRHNKFEEYKAKRPKLPKELSLQITIIKELVKALGIKIVEEEGIEADDAIASIANNFANKGYNSIIFSEDKDFLQIESERIKIFNPRKFEFMSAEEKFGIRPNFIPDFIALTGDTIDNIYGIPGIGEKTAKAIINEFGSVEEIYKNIGKIGNNKIREALLKYKEQAILSKELALLKKEHPIPISIEETKIGKIDKKKLFYILKELEFFSIIKKLDIEEIDKKEYILEEDEFLENIKEEASIFFYTDADEYFGIANKEKTVIFKNKTQKVKKIIENEKIRKITDNAKYLFKNFNVKGDIFDISLASYLLNPGIKEHTIENIALQYIGEPLITDKQNVIKYVGQRAEAIYKIYKYIKKEIENKNLSKLLYEIEIPLSKVLADMEKTGVLIDTEYFKKESLILAENCKKLEEEIYILCGEKFNINSPKQLSHILFEKIKLPKSKKRKTGYATDQSVLIELAKNYEIPRKLLEYRELYKLKSTYIEAIPKLKDSNNRVHTDWQQTITATGRLASANPNLQNIPKKEIRKGFIAQQGYLLISADYSQIELRILASLSEDNNLILAFKNGEDIHQRTADLIGKDRETAKTINFGIIYGMGPYGIAQRLDISVEEAASIIALYFIMYPGVKKWIDSQLEFARKNEYVETLLGRRRELKFINSDNTKVREFEERVAVNTPIQGTAADMIKIAMIKIYEKIKNMDAKIIMQVHDELILEVQEKEMERVKNIVKNEMENALKLKVPVVVNIGVGKNWLERQNF